MDRARADQRGPAGTGEAEQVREPPDLRLLVPAGAAWAAALAAADPHALVGLLGTLAVATALARAAGSAGVRVATAALACALVAGLSGSLHVRSLTTGPVADAAARGAAARLVVEVADDPRRVRSRAGAEGNRWVVPVRTRTLVTAGRTTAVRVPVLVLASGDGWGRLLPSTRLVVAGVLRAPDRPGDVTAVLSVRGPPDLRRGPGRLHTGAGALRAGLRAAADPLSPGARGLLPGLVVGDTSRLPAEVVEQFRATGMTHLVAVSGTNVAIVLAAVLGLARAVGVPARLRAPVALLALVGFVVLARPSPSVLRAAVMGALVLLALALGSRRSALPALCAAVTVLVVARPGLASSAGFVLSVLATAGLLVWAPGWSERLAAGTRVPTWLAQAVVVPVAAQVACAPVVAALFGTVSLVAVPANLLAAPAVAPATLLGVAAAVVAPVAVPAAQVLTALAALPVEWLLLVARVGADVPHGSLGWPGGPGGAVLLAAAIASAGYVLTRARGRRLAAAVVLGVTAASVLVRPVTGWPPPGWVLVVCDVGQGDALVLDAGDGRGVVVDAGPDPDAVDRCLDRLAVRAVALVLLTHAHADHVDGLPGVARGRPVAQLALGPLDEPEQQAARVRAWAAGSRVPVVRSVLGERRRLGPLTWDVLAPARAFAGTTSDPNNSSLVLRVASRGVTALLTGDVEPPAQRALLRRPEALRVDMVKVPHHGSRHQEPAFLVATGARLAVASVGAGNGYGHPAPATLRVLEDAGARVARTDRDGDVALLSHAGTPALAVRGDADGGPGEPGDRRGHAPARPAPGRRRLHHPLPRPGAPHAGHRPGAPTPGAGRRAVACPPHLGCRTGRATRSRVRPGEGTSSRGAPSRGPSPRSPP